MVDASQNLVATKRESNVVPHGQLRSLATLVTVNARRLKLPHANVNKPNGEETSHGFKKSGVYVSVPKEVTSSYARPQVLFGNGEYPKVALEVQVDLERRRKLQRDRSQSWPCPTTPLR